MIAHGVMDKIELNMIISLRLQRYAFYKCIFLFKGFPVFSSDLSSFQNPYICNNNYY